MTISATILCDSITPSGQRITTFKLQFPRFILPEINTHRVFSRNTASSRAIPAKTMIAEIRKNPATPIHWGQNQSGMQAKAELSPFKKYLVKNIWYSAMWMATTAALICDKIGGHKQIVNRLCEPFAHSSTVVTSTQWSNFYALRRHPDAQPEIKALADAMFEAQQSSTPRVLEVGQWHLPYITGADLATADSYIDENPDFELPTRFASEIPFNIDKKTQFLLAVSVARCARTSYRLHDGNATTFDADINLYARLLKAQPLHASPAEHQATAIPDGVGSQYSGNLYGAVQFRKLLVGETM